MKLASIQTSGEMFTLLAADQIVGIADRLGVALPGQSLQSPLQSVYHQIVTTFAPEISGVVLAPELGNTTIPQIFEQSGIILPLERRTFDADPLSVPILAQNWGVEAIRNNYAVAKLELFFNPEEKEAASKKQLVAEVYDYCQHEGIDLLLEVLVYMEGTEAAYHERFPELQLGAVQELRNLCSVLALEYPLNALGAVTVTAELDIPWILSMRDTPYDLAKEQLRTALESGACGFLAMEQFLPEKPETGLPEFDPQHVRQFIETTGRDRLIEVSRIVAEAGSANSQ